MQISVEWSATCHVIANRPFGDGGSRFPTNPSQKRG